MPDAQRNRYSLEQLKRLKTQSVFNIHVLEDDNYILEELTVTFLDACNQCTQWLTFLKQRTCYPFLTRVASKLF